MVQCPDCDSKDRITIAGKVFCANCGTPWVPSPGSNPAAVPAPAMATPATASHPAAAPPPSSNAAPTSTTPQVAPSNPLAHSTSPLEKLSASLEEQPTPTAATTGSLNSQPTTKAAEAKPPLKPVKPILPESPLEQKPAAAVTLHTPRVTAPKPPPAAPVTAASPSISKPAIIQASTDHKLAQASTNQSPNITKFHARPPVSLSPATATKTATPAPVPTVTATAPLPPATQAPQANLPTLNVPPKPRPATIDKPLMPTPAPSASLAQTPGLSTSSMPSTSAQVPLTSAPTPAPTPSAPVDGNAIAATGSDVEFSELDKKAPPILSDAQFKDLANMSDSPLTPTVAATPESDISAPVPSPTPAPAPTPADVVSSAPNVVTTPPIPAPQATTTIPINTSTPLPSPQPAPLPSAPAPMSAQTNTAVPVAVTSPQPVPTPAAALPPTGRLQDVIMSPAVPATTPALTPAASPTAGQLATIDGVTMSRDQALKLALDSNTPPSTGSYKPLKIAAGLVVVLLIGGYIWQINYPNLALKVAAARAGVSANLPNYVPEGWQVDHSISASSGTLQYRVHSPNGQQSLTVTQTKSDWDAQALLENFVLDQTTQYTALQSQGLTIYVYNNNQVTWVNRGSWFKLDGSGSKLSQDQIVKIATNL